MDVMQLNVFSQGITPYRLSRDVDRKYFKVTKSKFYMHFSFISCVQHSLPVAYATILSP